MDEPQKRGRPKGSKNKEAGKSATAPNKAVGKPKKDVGAAKQASASTREESAIEVMSSSDESSSAELLAQLLARAKAKGKGKRKKKEAIREDGSDVDETQPGKTSASAKKTREVTNEPDSSSSAEILVGKKRKAKEAIREDGSDVDESRPRKKSASRKTTRQVIETESDSDVEEHRPRRAATTNENTKIVSNQDASNQDEDESIDDVNDFDDDAPAKKQRGRPRVYKSTDVTIKEIPDPVSDVVYDKYWRISDEKKLQKGWTKDDDYVCKRLEPHEVALFRKTLAQFGVAPMELMPINVPADLSNNSDFKDPKNGRAIRNTNWPKDFCSLLGTLVSSEIFNDKGVEFIRYLIDYSNWLRIGKKDGHAKPSKSILNADRNQKIIEAFNEEEEPADESMVQRLTNALNKVLGSDLPPHFDFVTIMKTTITQWSPEQKGVTRRDLQNIISAWDTYAKGKPPTMGLKEMNQYLKDWKATKRDGKKSKKYSEEDILSLKKGWILKQRRKAARAEIKRRMDADEVDVNTSEEDENVLMISQQASPELSEEDEDNSMAWHKQASPALSDLFAGAEDEEDPMETSHQQAPPEVGGLDEAENGTRLEGISLWGDQWDVGMLGVA